MKKTTQKTNSEIKKISYDDFVEQFLPEQDLNNNTLMYRSLQEVLRWSGNDSKHIFTYVSESGIDYLESGVRHVNAVQYVITIKAWKTKTIVEL